MADPTTVNTSLAIPIRGTDVGTWDLPVNGNFNIIDSMFGGVTTIALSVGNVTLLSSQGQQAVIRLTGTLTSTNVNIVLPNIFKGWTIDNQVTNHPSSFAVLITTSGSTYTIGAPPGQNDIYYDGTTIFYRGMHKIGEYWDYAASAVPTWVTKSTKPPYLICDGTAFSSGTYPLLNTILGSTTVPDQRGRVRMMSNLGTNRVTIFNGDTLFLGGGDQQVQAHTHTGSGTTSGISVQHTHTYSGTTSTDSVDHTHTGSGTTSFVSADHTHAYSGTTSGDSVDHTHVYQQPVVPSSSTGGGAFGIVGTSSAANTSGVNQFHTHTYSGSTGGISANHTHTYSFTTSGVSQFHTHTYSGTTSVNSVDHTHTYSFTTSSFGSGASLNMQPTVVGGITMIRAA